MDVNEYMKRSLELQERTAAALEALVKAGFQQVNVAHHSCGKTTGATQTKQAEAETKQETKSAETKQEVKQETKPAETKQEVKQDAPAETKQEDKPKKVTADDARKALKAYAVIEGNDAAMELLTSMGASSVSALAEQGDDKLRELIAKCEDK